MSTADQYVWKTGKMCASYSLGRTNPQNASTYDERLKHRWTSNIENVAARALLYTGWPQNEDFLETMIEIIDSNYR